jgi:hypothetical protein
MKEINIKMTSVEVKAEVRELRCKYTREMAKDIEVFYNIDPSLGVDGFMRRTLRKESINNIFNITKHDK